MKSGTVMLSRRRVLVASGNADTAWTLHREITRLAQWELIGIVDPRISDTFERACAMADLVFLAADDLFWLWENRRSAAPPLLSEVRTVVILTDRQILEVVSRMPATCGFLLRPEIGVLPVNLLDLAARGYIALSESLFDRMINNRLRLDIAGQMSAEEKDVLAHIGGALSNRRIAQVSGLAESRVKTVVHLVTHKLHLANRTAVAVFATANGLANNGPGYRIQYGKSLILKMEVGPGQKG